MKKLSKYLIFNALKILFVTEAVGLVMFMTIEFFEHMEDFTSSTKVFAISGLYLLLRLPFYINFILPFAFLISMLVLIIIMIRHNEIITIRTSGISTAALMKPFIIFSLILALFSFALGEWFAPYTSSAAEYLYKIKIKKEEVAQVFFKNNRIWFKRNNTICNIDLYDAKKDTIKGITILELTPDYLVQRRYDAREGIFRNGAWYLMNVTERTFDKNGIVAKKTYSQLKDLIHEPPSIFKVVEKNPEDMSYEELHRHIAKLKADGHDVKRYLVDLYNKISFPFINVIMVFAAFSVGLRYVKTKHISQGILAGIVLGACYYFVHSIALSLGYSEIFPPIFAAWFSNFFFVAAGILGIVTLRT